MGSDAMESFALMPGISNNTNCYFTASLTWHMPNRPNQDPRRRADVDTVNGTFTFDLLMVFSTGALAPVPQAD
jgi:hypothetical protein